jgi:virginiamycin B lyase
MKSPFVLRSIVLLGAALWALPATAPAQIRSLPIPTPNSEPISIILGPDGNLWFTEQNASQVVRVTPKGQITEFRTPTFSFPLDITPGPDGNVWFSEGSNGQIAFVTPRGHIEEIFFSSSGTAGGIVTGPDGNIWFTDMGGNSVWRLDLSTRDLVSFPLPTAGAFPSDITVGADGNLWFVEQVGAKIGRITPDGDITEFGQNLKLPYSIAAGPDGNIWFTERFVREIGKVTPNGEFTFYPIPASAEEIARGHGDSLIFTEFGSSKIARITTEGVVTESPEIPDSFPTGITAGPFGSIWFLGYGNDRVYRTVF